MRTAADIARERGGQPVRGGGFLIRCPLPSHGQGRGDRNPSLAIKDGEKGLVVDCKCGCDWRAVLAALGYEPNGKANGKANGKPSGANGSHHEPPKRFSDCGLTRDDFKLTATYDYVDRDGDLLHQVVRYEHATEKKQFLQRRPDGCGGWWSGAGSRKVLYRWPDLAKHGHLTVFVTEGEKDADGLASHGLLAVTVASGSWSQEAIEALKGYDCLILEDNDRAGRAKALKAAEALHGVARSVRIVRLPGLADGADVTDWLNAGNDVQRLQDIAKAAPEWRPDGEQAKEQPKAGTDDDLTRMNSKYCVIRDGGKTRVLTFDPVHEKEHKRLVPTYLSFEDFRNFHCNRPVRVGDRSVPLGSWWLKHPERRQYEGITFQPGEGEEVDGKLNLWRGWGIPPEPGDWSLMRRHIEEVLAAGNAAAADYIIKWVAWAVQHPDERAQVVLAFKGPRGTGKGTLGNALCKIFGQHGTHISSAEHLAGRFNGHLRDACLLFADEAYWPGDKGAEGSLKRLVTEPDLFIEAKGRDGVSVPNMLHIMMASNEDWIVPAGEAERRYAVFEVSDCHKQDEAWFRPLYAEMESGGLAAMLHDMLLLDLGDWHPRRIPKTKALMEQQARSLSPEDEWWVGLLEAGQIPACDPHNPRRAVSNDYTTKVESLHGTKETKHHGLYHHARVSSPRLRSKSDAALGRHLTGQGCKRCWAMRQRGWEFPSLSELRAKWKDRFPGWEWESPELKEWQSDAT